MARPEDADYIVVRGTGTPLDGTWYDLQQWRDRVPDRRTVAEEGQTVVLTPTGMIEVRESDDAVAEIWAPENWRTDDGPEEEEDGGR